METDNKSLHIMDTEAGMDFQPPRCLGSSRYEFPTTTGLLFCCLHILTVPVGSKTFVPFLHSIYLALTLLLFFRFAIQLIP